MKKALITGITGQDGSYLCELLLNKGYEVHGTIRRASTFNTGRIDHVFDDPNLHLHHCDLTDSAAIGALMHSIKPLDEIYNLAAQSHVAVSFALPINTTDITGLGALRMLEAVRWVCPEARYYQASSSEMFGNSMSEDTIGADEGYDFAPASPYACAKLMAHHATITYRKSYGLFAVCGILFNHESPRRGETFVTRKITRAVGRIAAGLQTKLRLGNMRAMRDWGWAPDYVRAMWLMLQQDEPRDYVIATGEGYSVEEFCARAFGHAAMEWQDYVEHDAQFDRPNDVKCLLGRAWRAKKELDWEPTMPFPGLVGAMVDHDLSLARTEAHIVAEPV